MKENINLDHSNIEEFKPNIPQTHEEFVEALEQLSSSDLKTIHSLGKKMVDLGVSAISNQTPELRNNNISQDEPKLSR